MIMEGLRLMAVGMITVFAFLTLLVGMMKASAAFFEKFADRFPEEEHPEKSSRSSADSDGEIALVLAIAEAHRQGQRV